MRLTFIGLLGILVSSSPVVMAQNPPGALPTATVLIAKAIAHTKEEYRHHLADQYAWTQHSIEQKLDNQGDIQERTERVLETVVVNGRPYRRLVLKNGKPLTSDEQQKEAEREKKFRETLAKPKRDGKDDDDLDLNEEMANRFRFTTLARDEVAGRQAYIVSVLPKPEGTVLEKRRFDKLLNRMQGRIWLDEESGAVVKIDMHLSEPTNLLGVLVNIRSVDFVMEFAAVGPDEFAPKNFSLDFEGRKLFSFMHVKENAEFSGYKKLSEVIGKTPILHERD